MEITIRQHTLPTCIATIGVLQLLGVLYTYIAGFNPWALHLWAGALGLFTVGALIGNRFPGWVRGIFFGLVWYTGFQLAFGLVGTPTPPTTGEYILATIEGVGTVIVAVMVKRWSDAGYEAAKLDQTTLDQQPTE